MGQALSDAAVATFWEQGYLLVKGVLSRSEAAHYRDLILDLVPRDLTIPPEWGARAGRLKPAHPGGAAGVADDGYDEPEFLPLWCNEKLYQVAAQLLESPRLRVFDGTLGITLRNTGGDHILSQPLHLDASVPTDRDNFLFTLEETQLGGCYYLTDVEPTGGGIHVVPGGPRLVAEKAGGHPRGRSLYHNWKRIDDFPPTVEVTGEAGDFVLAHHLMPHAASHNRLPGPRVAQFTRFVRTDHPHGAAGPVPPDRYGDRQLRAMTPLGRKLLGVDPWDTR